MTTSGIKAMKLKRDTALLEGQKAAELSSQTVEDVAGFKCQGCKSYIEDSHLLRALNSYWHEDCLRCSVCQVRLGEVGSSLYCKHNMHLCKRDYLRLFGLVGQCAVCDKQIPSYEMVMRVKEDFVYHIECFACQKCGHRFCVGDRCYLLDGKIVCEIDYEQQISSINMSAALHSTPINYNGGHIAAHNRFLKDLSVFPGHVEQRATTFCKEYNALHQLQQQTLNIKADDSSSGYGSPSPTTPVLTI